MQVETVSGVDSVDYSDPFAFKPFRFNSLNPLQGRGGALGKLPFYELMFDRLGMPQTAYYSPIHTTPHLRPEYAADPDSPSGSTKRRTVGTLAVVQTRWSKNKGWTLARDDYRTWHDDAPEKIGKVEACRLRAEFLGKTVEELTKTEEAKAAFEAEAMKFAPTKELVLSAWEHVQKWHDDVLDPKTRFMTSRRKFPAEWIPPSVRKRWALRDEAVREGVWDPDA